MIAIDRPFFNEIIKSRPHTILFAIKGFSFFVFPDYFFMIANIVKSFCVKTKKLLGLLNNKGGLTNHMNINVLHGNNIILHKTCI